MKEDLFEQLSGIADEELPRMVQVQWHRPSLEIEDLEGQVKRELDKLDLSGKIKPGAEIVVTADSRGI